MQARPGTVPNARRRLACLLYESVLLLGVTMAGGLAYGLVTQQRHALSGQTGLRVWAFTLLGLYFVWFWTHGGQTLAAKTWRLRVRTDDGSPVRLARATLRYVLGWLWVLPALALVHWAGWHGAWATSGALGAGVLGYLALGRLHQGGSLPHEWLSRTRLVHEP